MLPQFQVPVAGMRAVALAWPGRLDEARAAADEAVASASTTSVRHQLEAAAVLEVEASAGPSADPARSHAAFALAVEAEPPDHGLTRRARRAEVAACAARPGHGVLAADRWIAAADAWAALAHPFAEARDRLRAAEDLLAGGDRDAAAASLQLGLATARRGRAAAVEAAILDLGRRARLALDRSRPAGGRSPAEGPLRALTAREREVLALVAEGR